MICIMYIKFYSILILDKFSLRYYITYTHLTVLKSNFLDEKVQIMKSGNESFLHVSSLVF